MNNSKIIAFWSTHHGQTCTTSNMLCCSLYMAMKYNLHSLLVNSQVKLSNFDYAFFNEKEVLNPILNDVGIDSVERLARSKQLCAENIADYTKEIVFKRLEILLSSRKQDSSILKNLDEFIQYILLCAKQAYDIVFCDINSGVYNDISTKAIQHADLVVVNLNQNISVLKNFFEGIQYKEFLSNKDFIVLLGDYKPSSRYTPSYIKRLFKFTGDIFVVPHNVDVMDYSNESRLHNYFFMCYDSDKGDKAYPFMQAMDSLVSGLLKHLSYDAKYLYNPIEKVSFLSLFK